MGNSSCGNSSSKWKEIDSMLGNLAAETGTELWAYVVCCRLEIQIESRAFDFNWPASGQSE